MKLIMRAFTLKHNNKYIICYVCIILISLFSTLSFGCNNTSNQDKEMISNSENQQDTETKNMQLEAMHMIYGSLADVKIKLIIGNSTENINIYNIAKWIDVTKNGSSYSYTINDEKLCDYTKKLSDKYSNYQNYVSFKANDGTEKTLENKSTGWIFDNSYAADKLKDYIDNRKSVTINLTDKSEASKKWWVRISADYDTADKKGDCYAEISIDKQYIWVYKNGKVILESNIITGSPGSNDTPTGFYFIYQKKHPATLYGTGYETEVSYWMAFNNDIGFHDAVWQNNFGGDEYLYNGSHGCVNLPLDVAEKLYNISYINMPVYVY